MKFLSFLLLVPFFCFAQKQGNIWYFGNHAGLDFNSGAPMVLNDGQTQFAGGPIAHAEGTSVMADSSGSLLFYCDGSTIWNRNHQVMQNGDSLLSDISSTQSSLIVPQPGSSNRYWVFNADDFFLHGLIYGFRYSIVDICLDNGLGGVIPGQKNILILDTVAEKLTAVRHSNGTDYWVIVHKFYSDAFYCYRLSAAGITDTVISHIGSVHTSSPSPGAAIGQLKASPNGQKLALVNGNVNPAIAEYFDFNTATGVVSHAVSIQTNALWNYYGVSFSPNNSKLYMACYLNGNGVYQFDLSAGGGNPDSVRASQTQVAGGYNFLGLQLATDGKIYVAHSPFVGCTWLGVINAPNNGGAACDFVDPGIFLNGHDASYGLPNFIDSYDYPNTKAKCETEVEEESDGIHVSIFPNPFSSYLQVNTNNSETYELRVFNILSQVIFLNRFSGSTTVETEQLAKGIYIFELKCVGKPVAQGKIFKQ